MMYLVELFDRTQPCHDRTDLCITPTLHAARAWIEAAAAGRRVYECPYTFRDIITGEITPPESVDALEYTITPVPVYNNKE